MKAFLKNIFITIIVYHTLNTMLFATVDAQINAIQNASPKERFKLMNAFKKNLLKMKEKERIEAVKKLSKNSQKKHAKKVLKELEENTKRSNMKTHIEQQFTQDTLNNNIDYSEGGNNDNN